MVMIFLAARNHRSIMFMNKLPKLQIPTGVTCQMILCTLKDSKTWTPCTTEQYHQIISLMIKIASSMRSFRVIAKWRML
jgi:hypothetical protein